MEKRKPFFSCLDVLVIATLYAFALIYFPRVTISSIHVSIFIIVIPRGDGSIDIIARDTKQIN